MRWVADTRKRSGGEIVCPDRQRVCRASAQDLVEIIPCRGQDVNGDRGGGAILDPVNERVDAGEAGCRCVFDLAVVDDGRAVGGVGGDFETGTKSDVIGEHIENAGGRVLCDFERVIDRLGRNVRRQGAHGEVFNAPARTRLAGKDADVVCIAVLPGEGVVVPRTDRLIAPFQNRNHLGSRRRSGACEPHAKLSAVADPDRSAAVERRVGAREETVPVDSHLKGGFLAVDTVAREGHRPIGDARSNRA